MRSRPTARTFLLVAWLLVAWLASSASGQAVPPGIVTEDVPPIPRELIRAFADYRVIPGYTFAGWFGGRREMLLVAGDEVTSQVFSAVHPGAPPHQLTQGRERVMGVYPRPGRNQFAFAYDRGGDEEVQFALFDTPKGRATRLTSDRARHGSPAWSRDGRRLAYVSDARNGRDLDVYVLDLSLPGDPPRLLAELTGLTTITDWSPDGHRLAVVSVDPQIGSRALLLDAEGGAAEQVFPRTDAPQIHSVADVRWAEGGGSLVFTMYDDSEFRRLGRLDLETGEAAALTADVPWDLDDYDLADDGRTAALVFNEDGASGLRLLDVASGQELTAPELPVGQVYGLAFRPGAQELGFNLTTAQAPPQAYSYLIPNRTLVRWTNGLPGGLRFGKAAEPEQIRYESFDGREIPAIVYRPDPARFQRPRPVLIDIHGGPQAQYRPGFLGTENYLINELGLVLIRPNVRGSSGYGRSFMTLDDRLNREDAVRDVGALLDWIGQQDDLDASRVALTGGSYGGYMVLAALVHYGDRIRAAIDIAGISSFETFLDGQEDPLRLDLLRLEFGDERDPDIRAFLRSISPLEHAREIKTPLLVVQGANDPRVPVGEARQIVDAVRANGVPVWYVLARDEGHGFSRRPNREYLEYVQILFLLEHLRKS